MGYYVHAIDSTACIRSENLEKAYEALCALNADDGKKRGGNFGTPRVRPASSHSVSRNPNRWFSWMPWNYDETCADVSEILEHLGFYTSFDEEGSLHFSEYDDKSGQEELFIRAIALLIEPGTHIRWVGEDDELWEWQFDGSSMRVEELVGDAPYQG